MGAQKLKMGHVTLTTPACHPEANNCRNLHLSTTGTLLGTQSLKIGHVTTTTPLSEVTRHP